MRSYRHGSGELWQVEQEDGRGKKKEPSSGPIFGAEEKFSSVAAPKLVGIVLTTELGCRLRIKVQEVVKRDVPRTRSSAEIDHHICLLEEVKLLVQLHQLESGT